MLIRHSRETFAKPFKWYAGSALVGIAALLAVGVVLDLQLPVTADYAVMGIILISPFLVGLTVLGWRRVEVLYRQQIKAMMTSSSGLQALEKDRKRKLGD